MLGSLKTQQREAERLEEFNVGMVVHGLRKPATRRVATMPAAALVECVSQ